MIALRDMAHRLASSEKASAAAEQAEARLVPILRSVENAMLATDAAELLRRCPRRSGSSSQPTTR